MSSTHLDRTASKVFDDHKRLSIFFSFDKSEYEKALNISLLEKKPSHSKRDVKPRKEKSKEDTSVNVDETCKYTENAEPTNIRESTDVSNDNTLNRKVLSEHKSTIRMKEQKSNLNEQTPTNNTMFNIGIEYGPNKDENLASTLMGIAVKNGSSWRTYDKKKKEIVDLGSIQLGNFPIFIVPSTKTKEGDLIKDCGEYHFVLGTCTDGIEAVNARTGEMKFIVPIRSIFGFRCYSKIIALFDFNSVGEKLDAEELMVMYSTLVQQGGATEQLALLLPLMLIYKEGNDNIRTNVILMTSLIHEKLGGNVNPMLNYIWFKKLAEKEEI